MSDSTPASATDKPAESSRPNHLDLYLLIAGVLFGILIGPAVMGRLAPETYHRYFVSVELAALELAGHDRDLMLKHMIGSLGGESQGSLNSQELVNDPSRRVYLDQLNRAHASRGRLLAVLLAVMVVMVLETLPSPSTAWVRDRLITARYALIALLIALLLAQPDWLTQLPVMLLVLLLAVVMAAVLVPMRFQPRAAV